MHGPPHGDRSERTTWFRCAIWNRISFTNRSAHRCDSASERVVAILEPPAAAARDDAAERLAVSIAPVGNVETQADICAAAHHVVDFHQPCRRAHVKRDVSGLHRKSSGLEDLRRSAERGRQKRMRHERAIVDRHRGAVANRQTLE